MTLTKRQQQQYLSKKNGEWQQQLRAFADTRDPEALRRLRVALKKIKAVTRFSKACAGKRSTKDFKGLKKMFKQAGLIRDTDNQLRMLEQFHPALQEYKARQEQARTTETQKFLRRIKGYRNQGRRTGRRLIADVRNIPATAIYERYAIQMVATGILLTASGDDLHMARRQIKDMLCVEKLLPPPMRENLRLDREYLQELQAAIGQWHDVAIVVADWAGKNFESSPEMLRDCGEKEAIVHHLAADFYLRAHLTAPPIALAAPATRSGSPSLP